MEHEYDMDEIGYEAGRIIDQNGEIQSYSHLDMEILGKFVNVLAAKDLVESNMDKGQNMHLVTPDKQEVLKANSQQVSILNTIAGNIYTFYGDQEHMKEAFNQVLHGREVDKELKKQNEIRQLQVIWENND